MTQIMSAHQRGYTLGTTEMLNFIIEVYLQQGKTSNNCTEMSSFSFWPEKLTFWAGMNCICPANEHVANLGGK